LKFLALILFSFTLYAQGELIVQRTDSDSLFQDIEKQYTIEENTIVLKLVNEINFIMRIGTQEYLCPAGNMPKSFFRKIEKRQKKAIDI